jgi:hypothetical protein
MNEMTHDIKLMFKYLESHEFSAEINVYSDLRSIEKGILSNQKVAALIKLCLENTINALEEIFERISNLTNMSIDPRYESPWDAALAAYLIVLQSVDRYSALLAANIVSRAPQTWWAGKISNRLLTTEKDITNSANEFVQIPKDERETLVLHMQQLSSPDRSASYKLIVADMTAYHQGWKVFKLNVNPKPNISTVRISREAKLREPLKYMQGAGTFPFSINTDDSISDCEVTF